MSVQPQRIFKAVPLSPAIRLVKIREAAALLGVSAVTIRRRVQAGTLPHIRISSRLYFKPAELQAFVEAHRGSGFA